MVKTKLVMENQPMTIPTEDTTPLEIKLNQIAARYLES